MQGRRADELLLDLGQQPMVHHNGYMNAAVEWLLGDPVRAREIAEASADGARDLGNRVDEAYALSTLGLIGVSAGELGAAIARADESVDIASTIAAPRVELTTRASGASGRCRSSVTTTGSRRTSSAPGRSGQGGRTFPAPAHGGGLGMGAGAGGARGGAEASFADAVRAASDTPGELLLALRLEVACWEERGDGRAWLARPGC